MLTQQGAPELTADQIVANSDANIERIKKQLNLTAEQKEKISRVQKEAEEKVMEVLTEKQKKEIEEMKRRIPGVPAPAAPVPPREKNG